MNPISRNQILKFLQYEGKENNQTLVQKIELGQQICALTQNYPGEPADIIEILISTLGFHIMLYAKSDESRAVLIKFAYLMLLKNSNISLDEIERHHEELKKAGFDFDAKDPK